jgi:Arc/MetJ family transcription regulator
VFIALVLSEKEDGRVYDLHMGRTNIEIDDELIARVMRQHGLSTKRAAVDMALRRVDIKPMTREEALAMQGRGWEGDLDEMRRNDHPPNWP